MIKNNGGTERDYGGEQAGQCENAHVVNP